jgi:hypothetical protein
LLQLELEPLFASYGTQTVETTGLGRSGAEQSDVGERRSTPKPQSLLKAAQRSAWVPCGALPPRLCEQQLKAVKIECAALDV